MDRTSMVQTLGLIEAGEYMFKIGEKNGVLYLQASYMDGDAYTGHSEMQHTRKWQLSEHMTKSEFVQTAFKCVVTSMEHRAREMFKYKGQRVFGPHFDVDALCELAANNKLDVRP